MKTIPFCWVRIIALFIFCAMDSHFDRCHADPLTSWNPVLTNSPAGITSMAYGNGTFIGVGGGFRFISHDGANWTVYANAPIINNGGVAFGTGMFLTFGTNNQYKANYILQSTNGTTWTTIYTSSITLFAGACGNNTWVFVGTNEIVTANVTSSNWSWSEFQPSFLPVCVTYANGIFVIGAYQGSFYSVFSSSDGITWQYISSLGYNSTFYFNSFIYTGIAFGNGLFVASTVNSSGSPQVFVSSNLVNWTLVLTNTAGALPYGPIAFGGNYFIASTMGSGVNAFTSSNGYTWNPSMGLLDLSTLTYGQGTFVAANEFGGLILQSGVFANQTNSPATTLGISTYPGVTINGTAGVVYQVQYTTNLNSTWQTLTNFMLPYSPYLWFDITASMSGRRFYRSIQLQ
jgi:hypothetical protein